jgi:hypothetical protein
MHHELEELFDEHALHISFKKIMRKNLMKTFSVAEVIVT